MTEAQFCRRFLSVWLLVTLACLLAISWPHLFAQDDPRGHYMGPPDNCTHGQTISWDATAKEWVCATAGAGGGGGAITCGIPALTLTTASAAGDSGQAICTNSTLGIFDSGLPAALGTAAGIGAAQAAARRDHIHQIPASIMAGNGDLLTITSDGSTVTASPTAGRHLSLASTANVSLAGGTGIFLDTASGNVDVTDPIVFHSAPRPDANGSVGVGVVGTGIANAVFANTLSAFTTTVQFSDLLVAANGTLTINLRGDDTQTLDLPVYYFKEVTNNDQITFTSNGADYSLQNSRAGSDLIWKDSTGTAVFALHDSSGGNRGAWTQGHALVGMGTALIGSVQTANILAVSEATSSSSFGVALQVQPRLNSDVGSGGINTGGLITANYGLALATGFDATDGVGGGETFTLAGHRVNWVGSLGGAALLGEASDVVLFDASANLTVPAGSADWNTAEIAGFRLNTLTFTNVSTPSAPLRSYGIKIGATGPGTLKWAGMFGGDVQVTASNKLRFGAGLTTQATDTLYRPSAGSLRFEIAGAGELDLNATALSPAANGGLTLGANNLGYGSLALKDTGAAFESTLQFTDGSVNADNTLTVNMGNASRTMTFSGNPTLNDWFDQSVKTTASPTFVSPVVTTSLLPDATGGASIGSATLGFTDAFFKDDTNAVEHRVKLTGATADRTLTVAVTDADRTLTLPIGYTNVNTHGLMFWGDASDAFDTGDEVCPSHSLVCVTTFTPLGINQTCAFDHGTAGTYFYALCK